MTVAEIIRQAQAEGVGFRLAAPEGLRLVGEREVVARWLPTLKPHKPAILDALLEAERQRIMTAMVDWNERAALMTNASTPPEQAEALAWHDLSLDDVFFGLRRVN